MQRYELHKSQISDDFVYWFRNGEDIFQAVLRKKSLKMSVLYWRVPYICDIPVYIHDTPGYTCVISLYDKIA